MKLFVPNTFFDTERVPQGHYKMTAQDALILQKIMEFFNSFDELRAFVLKNLKEQARRHELRYDFDIELPRGINGDTLAALLNVFGDRARDGVVPSSLDLNYAISKLSEELGISFNTAKKRIMALVSAGYTKISFGRILCPLR